MCEICGSRHEPEYPHQATEQLRRYVQQQRGHAATAYDLVRHTKGLMREAVMSELLRKVEV